MAHKSRKPRPRKEPTQRISVDIPVDLLAAIDVDATRIGISRQAWIKMRCSEYLDKRDHWVNCLREKDPPRK